MSQAGKMTIFVQHTRNGEVITVRTTGVVGATPVNTISTDVGYGSRTSAPDAVTYWTAILARVATQL